MYKKIVCFDFDGTLINTPTPELGRGEWEKQTGLSWAGRGWWGSAESLNTNVFHPPVNGWVYKYYEKYMNDPEAYVFLATGRLKKLEPQVLDVLDLHGITFKPSKDSKTGVYCNTGGETFNFKKHLFETKMKENPSATEFIMFDDRYEHLIKFVEWSKHQPIDIKIVDVLNKTEMKTKHLNHI
jgi:hydroxymethylpyrimidine pyrophosphatase-like HAD family hydrolase